MRLFPDRDAAARLGREIRTSHSAAMRERRAIAALALAASVPLGAVALWQIGAIGRLPDPPLPLFDSERVTGSGEAYRLLSTGDAFAGLASYAGTVLLAGIGPAERAAVLDAALSAKVFVDVAMAAKLAAGEWRRHGALCFLCLVTAAATFAMVPYATRIAIGRSRVVDR